MGLKDGTLQSLVLHGSFPSIKPLAQRVLHQMLQALDYLSAKKQIIHRDVKPENILYTRQSDGEYIFHLGDFGLCNHTVSAKTTAGSPLYMAPEVPLGGKQTDKVDIWSLFVTIAWTLDTDGFRQKSTQFKTGLDAQQAIVDMGKTLPLIQEMARVDPQKRASAAQMLLKCFDGHGLTTKRSRVPPMPTESSSSISTDMPPPPLPRASQSTSRSRAASRDSFRVQKRSESRSKRLGQSVVPMEF